MFENFDLRGLVGPLLTWFEANARPLPWRENVTPYRVWVSEIMLQQTRVEAVKPYYTRFVTALPTVADLAACEEERLLKLWEGLGYYNRARNMQAAARTVMEKYGGEIPADYGKLLSLKGIGRYTAGAIASIAFGIPVPAVDGNVLRVLTRVSEDDADIARASVKTAVEQALAEVMPAGEAGTFNQALMELGATVCVPGGEPLCGSCPWTHLCMARAHGTWERLPVKTGAKARRVEKRTVLILRDGERVALRRRPSRGLLAGLYEFPNVEGHLSGDEALQAARELRLTPMRIRELPEARHIFSHVEWQMRGYLIQVDTLTSGESGLLFAEAADAEEKYPLPSAFSSYAECIGWKKSSVSADAGT